MTKDSYGYPTKIPTKITDLYGGDDIPSSDDIVEEIEDYLDVDIATEGQVLTMGADGIVEWDDVASGGVSYSTDEKVVGTWIDGSNIYQKSFVIDTTIASQEYVSLNIGGYYSILNCEMVAATSTTTVPKKLLFTPNAGEYDNTKTKFKVQNPKSSTLVAGTVITLKYIKDEV